MKKISIVIFILIIAATVMSFDILSSNGKAGKTGSPGETDCTSCHAGTVNSGGGSVVISSPTLTGWAYSPNQTYQINVTVSQMSIPLFGLGFEALDAAGANAGTLVITNTTETQIKTATIATNVRNNIVDKTDAGLTPNSHTYSFDWIAPATNIGNVTFYVAGCACDNNGGTSGDFTYTTSQIVTFATGINESVNEKFEFTVYPNPATEKTTLRYLLKENSNVSFELVSVTGKIIFENFITNESAGVEEHSLLLNTISSGLYFVNLNINGIKYTKKVFVF